MTRDVLPNRRPSDTLTFEIAGVVYTATLGFYLENRVLRLGEVFLSGGKPDSAVDIGVRECGIAASFALQHGATPERIAAAMPRLGAGTAIGPLGTLFDLLQDRET